MESQLGLPLVPREPQSLDYLVPHLGIVEAVESLEAAVEAVSNSPGEFRSLYLHGPAGCGKTHVAQAYVAEAKRRGVAEQQLRVFDWEQNSLDDDDLRVLISEYERLKREGGLLLLVSRAAPDLLSGNDHALSRLRAGQVIKLGYPTEEELTPLLRSLSERKNLNLSDRNLEYLVRRLPLNPLSFEAIFASIDEFSLAQGKPARLGVIRAAVRSIQEE